MKKKHLILIISITIVIITVTAISFDMLHNRQKGLKPKDISEKELMNMYLDMLIEHKKYADTLYTDTSNQVEGTGYFGKGGGQKMRTSNNYALFYAFLYTQLPGSKYMPDSTDEPSDDAIENKDAFLEEVKQKALSGIKYGIYTHNAVKKMETIEAMATDSGKWWGPNNWQSSLYANGLLLASSFMWDYLDDDLKIDIEKVAAAEGDRAIKTNPKTYSPGNTGAEENAWDTNAPALAYCLFPNHERADKWNESAIKFAMNTFSRDLDKNDDTVIDGKPVSKWLTTSNLFADYSLENHNILHPTYVMSPLISYGDTVVSYAYHDKKVPDAFKYNVQKVADNVLKKLVYPTGEWAYPNGCDWTLNLPGKVEAFALLSVLLQDEEAKMLEISAAKMAVERQKIAGDGRFVHLADIGIEREAVNVKRIMFAYLLHKYVGNQPEKSVTWDEFIEKNKGTVTYLDSYVIANNSLDRFASLSWKNKYMGLITPNSNEYLEDKYISHPNLPNIFGNFNIIGSKTDRTYVTHKTYMLGEKFENGLYAGFSSIGYINDNGGAIKRYISMTVLPSNAVIVMDKTTAEKDLVVTSGYVIPISFQTDIVSGDKKVITTEEGKDSFKASQGIAKEYESSYVNVDDHTAVILDKSMKIGFGDYKVSSQIGGSTLKFLIESGEFEKGQNINNTTAVVYSNVDTDRLLELKNDISYLKLPEGCQGVLVKDTDGILYYVINNFYGNEGTFNYEGDPYVPLMLDAMSVKGKVASMKLQEGMASYTGVISKYVSTDGNEANIRNGKENNVFYVNNPRSEKVSVNVKFEIKGKESKTTLTVLPNETLKVFYDGKVKSQKIDSFPVTPEKVANLKAELINGSVHVTWDKSNNASSYIVSREDANGELKVLATLNADKNEYNDNNFAEGKSYKYCVVAVENQEGYASPESYTSFISTGEYKDTTGRINLAYNKPCKFESGTQATYPESLAVDDDFNTFTVNNDKLPTVDNPEYFEVELSGRFKIDEIVLLPRTTNAGYGPKDVEFFYTEDGVNYISLGTKKIANSSEARVNSIQFDPVFATKVKVKITSSYSVKNVQIAELKVYKSK